MTTAANEPVDALTPTTPPAAAEAINGEAEAPVEHVARCRECQAGAKFRRSASGASFLVLEKYGVDQETSFGVSFNGLPVCPNGHGEMAIADETLPVAEAIDKVRTALQGGPMEPLQGTLPGVFPVFNYQGAYLELEEKALEVDRLHRDYVDAAAEAKEAKKAWDKAAETYTKMALELRRRRREKVEQGQAVADLDPARCTYQQLHPDAECPLCSATEDLGIAIAPKDAAEHAQQADELILLRHVVEVEEQLEQAQFFITREVIRGWSDDEREAVKAYAVASYEQHDVMPARPSVLGTNHVAGDEFDEPQRCTQCDAVIGEGGVDTYPKDSLVGVDCPGKPVEEHRYPSNRGRKAAKKAKK